MSLLIGCVGEASFVENICSRVSDQFALGARWRKPWGAIWGGCSSPGGQIPTGAEWPFSISGNVSWREGRNGSVSLEDLAQAGHEIIHSDGEWLARNVWGRYIIALVDEKTQRVLIFRDPTGLHTVFYLRCDQGSAFATQLAVLFTLGLSSSLDAEYLRSFVLAGTRPTQRTALAHVAELEPGTMLEVSVPQCRKQLFWNPAEFARPNGQDQRTNPTALWETFAATVAVMVKDRNRISVDVSGGLDSAALLAAVCLASQGSPMRVSAVNLYHSEIASATELPFARELVKMLQVELAEVDMAECLPFTALSGTLGRRWNRPSPHMLASAMHQAQLAAAGSSDCLLNGFGGDQVFQARGEVPYFITDHLLAGHLMKFCADLQSETTQTGAAYLPLLWKCLLVALRQKRFATYWQPLAEPLWATTELVEASTSVISSPPFWSTRGITPGKRAQLFDIYDASAQTDQYFRSPDQIVGHPFLAQPVVELALSLPIHALLSGAGDRLLFRNALIGRVPDSIIQRRTKGEHSGIYQLGLAANYLSVEELLMEGWLARNDLVRRNLLREELQQAAQGYTPNLWPILNAVAVELWIRSWSPL